jgi:hypothetical protein
MNDLSPAELRTEAQRERASTRGLICSYPASPAFGDDALDLELVLDSARAAACYRLRYIAYRSVNAVPFSDAEAFCDRFDETANSRLHTVKLGGRLIGSIRASIAHGRAEYEALPSFATYPEAVTAACGSNAVIVESNRFVIHPDHERHGLAAQMLLFRAIALNGIVEKADFILTAVAERHMPFYRRIMKFKPISAARPFFGIATPMVLMQASFAQDYAEVSRKTPLLAIPQSEIESYRRWIQEPRS